MISMQRHDGNDALAILHAKASQWQWIIRGYYRETDIVLLHGVEGDDYPQPAGLDRYLLCRHPSYFLYGEMYSFGRGHIVSDPSVIDHLCNNMLPEQVDKTDKRIILIQNEQSKPVLLLLFSEYTLYCDGETI